MWNIVLQNFLKVAVVFQWLHSQFSGGDGENWPENLLESLIFSRDIINDAIGAVNRGGRLNWLQWCTVWVLKISLALVRLIAVVFVNNFVYKLFFFLWNCVYRH